MKRLIAAALLTAAALLGCARPGQQPGTNPQVAVFAVKGAYETALTVAVAYAQLPRCSTGTKAICSDQALVDQVVRARNVARDSIASAEGAVRTPGFGADVPATALTAAQAALDAFKAITTNLRVK